MTKNKDTQHSNSFEREELESSLAYISNDMNNLLLGISGNARILRDSPWIRPEGIDLVDEIIECAEKSAELTEKIVSIDCLLAEAISSQKIETEKVVEIKKGISKLAPRDLMEKLNRKRELPLVLIVDDQEVIRNVTSAILERAGYKVICAASGQEGLDIFERYHTHIHCVLLDLTMPYLRGNLVFARMKARDPDVRVFLMSGYSDKQVMQEFEESSIAGFLQKPFEPEQLLQALRFDAKILAAEAR